MTDAPQEPKKPEKDDSIATTVRLVSASHLAYFLPAAVIVGALVGRWVGRKFGHEDGGTLVGLLWGCATGVWEIFKVQKGLNRKG